MDAGQVVLLLLNCSVLYCDVQVMTPLMSGFEMQNAGLIAPSDPVELRRMNFQTPGMLSHPPIPVTELAAHTDQLKADSAAKFTAEYESIEPGQQFTWDNSSMDINKPKNRQIYICYKLLQTT